MEAPCPRYLLQRRRSRLSSFRASRMLWWTTLAKFTGKMAELEPEALGGTEGQSWRASLADNCSLTDCLDLAYEEGGLLSTRNFEGPVEELKNLHIASKSTVELFGGTLDHALEKRYEDLENAVARDAWRTVVFSPLRC